MPPINKYVKKPLPVKLRPLIDKVRADDEDIDETSEETTEFVREGLIAERAAERSFFREQRFKDHFERVMIIALWGCAIIFSVVFLLFIWHLLAPTRFQWISENKLNEIQNFIFGGFGGAAVTAISQHLRKRID